MTPEPLTNEALNELTIGLNRIARNLWWTWDEGAQEIFHELSPRGWQNLYHNAVAVLHVVPDPKLRGEPPPRCDKDSANLAATTRGRSPALLHPRSTTDYVRCGLNRSSVHSVLRLSAVLASYDYLDTLAAPWLRVLHVMPFSRGQQM